MTDTIQPIRRPKFSAIRDLRDYLLPHWSLWVVVLVFMMINVVWLMANPRLSVSVETSSKTVLGLVGIGLALLYWDWRRHTADRTLEFLFKTLSVALFIVVFTQQINLFSHLLVSLGLPLADPYLHAWDKALGFDWNHYVTSVAGSELNRAVLLFSYSVLVSPAILGIIMIAIWAQRHDRVNELAFLALTTGIACISISGLFPAEAAWNTIATPETRALLGGQPGIHWIDHFNALRSSDPVMFVPDNSYGIATFPSYHTCLALIVIWCSRGNPLAAFAGGVSGLAILASTPVYGAHYLVDMVAGGVITIFMIVVWSRMAQDWKHS